MKLTKRMRLGLILLALIQVFISCNEGSSPIDLVPVVSIDSIKHVQTGHFKVLHTNGSIYSLGQACSGKTEGSAWFFNPDGTLLEYGEYVNGKLVLKIQIINKNEVGWCYYDHATWFFEIDGDSIPDYVMEKKLFVEEVVLDAQEIDWNTLLEDSCN